MASKLEWVVLGGDESADVAMMDPDASCNKITLRSGIYGDHLRDHECGAGGRNPARVPRSEAVKYYWINVIQQGTFHDVIVYAKLPNEMKLGGYEVVDIELGHLITDVIEGGGFGKVQEMEFSFFGGRSLLYPDIFPNWEILFRTRSPCPVVAKGVTVTKTERAKVHPGLKSNCPQEERDENRGGNRAVNRQMRANRAALGGMDEFELEFRLPIHHVNPVADQDD